MKLPEISYGRATPMQGRGPGEAVVKARGINEISSALTDSFNLIAEADNQRKIEQATLQLQNDESMHRKEFAGREFFTSEEVERFGLSGVVPTTEGEDAEGKPMAREIIPGHEVYPLLLDKQMEEGIRARAQFIRRPKDRAEWVNKMTARRNSIVSREVEISQNKAIEARLREGMFDIAEAQRAGNWSGAEGMIRTVYRGNKAAMEEALYQNSISQMEGSADAVDSLMSSGIRAARTGNGEAVQASVSQYRVLVGDLRRGGAVPSQEAADKMVGDFQKTIAVEQIRTDFRQGLDSEGDIAAAAESLAEFRDKPLEGFTVGEQEKVFKMLVSDLNTHFALRNKQEDSAAGATKEMQDRTNERLYSGILTGDVDAGDVMAALSHRTITQSQAEGLNNLLHTRGRGVDSYPLINSITSDIEAGVPYEEVVRGIQMNTGVNLTEETASRLMNEARAYQEKESPLHSNKAKRAKDFITRSIQVMGPMGALDTEAERRLAQAHRDFSDAVLAGEDPFKAADRLVDRDAYLRAPSPRFGQKDNLDAAEDALNQQFESGAIDDTTYNYEYGLIERLREMQSNLSAFEEERKQQ